MKKLLLISTVCTVLASPAYAEPYWPLKLKGFPQFELSQQELLEADKVIEDNPGIITLGLLYEVNARVNEEVKYQSDPYGRDGSWGTPAQTEVSKNGDCEEFALLKMRELLLAGVPAASMYMIVGEYTDDPASPAKMHAALQVDMPDGKSYILDIGHTLHAPGVFLAEDYFQRFEQTYGLNASGAWRRTR